MNSKWSRKHPVLHKSDAILCLQGFFNWLGWGQGLKWLNSNDVCKNIFCCCNFFSWLHIQEASLKERRKCLQSHQCKKTEFYTEHFQEYLRSMQEGMYSISLQMWEQDTGLYFNLCLKYAITLSLHHSLSLHLPKKMEMHCCRYWLLCRSKQNQGSSQLGSHWIAPVLGKCNR